VHPPSLAACQKMQVPRQREARAKQRPDNAIVQYQLLLQTGVGEQQFSYAVRQKEKNA
jgi:hypothetical protein